MRTLSRLRDQRQRWAPMSTRVYARTYRAEVTETFALGPADLTDRERQLLDDLDAGGTTLTAQVDEILCLFDADHEDTARLDDRDLSIARTR